MKEAFPRFDDMPDESQTPAMPKFADMPDESQAQQQAEHAPTFTEAVRGLMPAPLSAVTEGAKNIREGFSPSQPTPMLERARNVASGAFDLATPALPRGFRKELKDKVNEGLAAINANLNPFSEEQQKLFKEELAHPGIESQWKKFKSVGEGLGGIGEVTFSPLTAAASTVAPLIAAPEATLFAQPDKINPFTGKPQTRENLYPQLKSGAELALSAGRPGRMPASVSPHAPAAPPPPPEAPFGVNLSRGQETRDIHDLTTQYAAETGKMEPATTEQGQPLPRPITEFAQERAAERAQQVEDAKDIATARLSPEGDIQARTHEEAGQAVKTALQVQEAERARQAAAEAERLRAKEIQSPSDAAEVVHDALTQRAAAQAAHTDAEATARAADIEGMRTSYSPDGQVYARTPMEAGDVMSRGVEAAEARAAARRDELYDVVDQHTGHVDPKNYVNVESEIKQTFKDPKDPFITSKETTPITLRAIDQISEDLGAPARAAAEAGSYTTTPFTPQAIGTVRKKLVQLAQDAASGASRSNNYSDVAGMQRVMEKFDDIFGRGARSHYNPETSVIQEAVNQAQGKQAKINAARRARYEAGQQVVADWEAARAAHRYLRKTFSAQGSGDRVGPLMARIVGRNNLDLQAMPGEELGRHLTRNPLLGRHLAELFPEGTIERAAAKQGILESAIGVPEGNAPLSAQKIAENLNKLRSSEVGRTWFSGPELEAMRAQAVRQRAAVPAPRAKTDFGKKVEDIVGEGGTPWTREQLAERLYNKHGPESEKLVTHVKDTFGENSEAFQAIQRGQLAALTRAEEGVAGFNPKEIAQDVRSFLRTDKSKILYTPEMRARLAQYADQLEMHAWETAASKDPVQKILANLREASPQEAANMLLGKTETEVKLDVLRHLQRTAPDTIVALRQAMFRKMIEPPADQIKSWTPLKIHKQIGDYLGKTPGVMRELFGPEGIKVLEEYKELQNKLHIPEEAMKNWNMPGFSRVVAALNKQASTYIHMMMGLVGLHASGNPWVAGAAMGASKFAGNWFASRVQAATFRKQMAEVRRLLPSAAEKLAEWQKAVDASHAAGQLPPYRAREAAAWTTASQIFDKLGLNLHQLIYRGSAAADDDENKRGVEKKRADGGRVEDDSAHDDLDTLAAGAGAIGEQSPLIQTLQNVATRSREPAAIHTTSAAPPSDTTTGAAEHALADPAELAAARVQRRYPQKERKIGQVPFIIREMINNTLHGIKTLPERVTREAGELQRTGEYAPGLSDEEMSLNQLGAGTMPAGTEAGLLATGVPLNPTRLFKPLPAAAEAVPKGQLRIAEHPERQFEGYKTDDDAWTFGSGARKQEGRAALAAATEGASRESAAATTAAGVPGGRGDPGAGSLAEAPGSPEAAGRLRAAQFAEQAAAGHQPLEGLPTEPITFSNGEHYAPGPVGMIRDAAAAYMEKAGLPYQPIQTYQPLNPTLAKRIAKAFADLPHTPNDPAVQASYKKMAEETLAQYRELENAGIKFEFIKPGQPDPYYENPRMTQWDFTHNKHLWVYPTETGFGMTGITPAMRAENPLLQKSGVKIDGQEVPYNDLFRIVHDVYGHIKEGVGFRSSGEDNAWRSHASMYSDLARPAMTTETRGQNNWVNYGPHGEFNWTANQAKTIYADQKMGLLPDWAMNEGRLDPMAEGAAERKPWSQMTDLERAIAAGRTPWEGRRDPMAGAVEGAAERKPWSQMTDLERVIAAGRTPWSTPHNEKTALQRVLRGQDPATEIQIAGDSANARAYESGRLQRLLKSIGMQFEENGPGKLIVGRTAEDIARFREGERFGEGEGTTLGSGARDQEGRAALAAVTESGGPAASRVVRRAADETGAGTATRAQRQGTRRGEPLPAAPDPTPEELAAARADTRVGSDIVNARLRVIVPDSERVVGGQYTPGAPGGGSWSDLPKAVLDRPGPGFRVTDDELNELWRQAVEESSQAAKNAVQATGASPRFMSQDWNAAMQLPLRDMLWYELSAEKRLENLPDLSHEEHVRAFDVLGATSALTPPKMNQSRELAVLSQRLRGVPIDVDLIHQVPVREALSRPISDSSALPGNKTGSFSDTLALTGGIPRRYPISVNDVWVGKQFGITDDQLMVHQSLHEPMAKYYNKVRDLFNERHADEIGFPLQSWNFQAPSWVHQRMVDTGAPSGDAYYQVWPQLLDQLKAAGVPGIEGEKITREALMDPRFADALRPTAKPFRESPKATIEFGTALTPTGKQAGDLYLRAIEAGDELTQSRYTDPIVAAMYKSGRSKDNPWNLLWRAITGQSGQIRRINFPTKSDPFDVGGTFEGAVSPNIRIPLQGGSKEQIEAFNAVAGAPLRQAAMAASEFHPATGKAPPEGYVQTHSIFIPTTETLTPNEIRSFAKAMNAQGHGMSYERHANGYRFDVLPAFTKDGIQGADSATVLRAYKASLGPKYGRAEITPKDFKTLDEYYTEAGNYAKVRSKLIQTIENEFIKEAIDAGVTEDNARQILARSAPPSSLKGGGKRVWERYQSRISDLTNAEAALREFAEDISRGHEAFVQQAKKRLGVKTGLDFWASPYARGGRVQHRNCHWCQLIDTKHDVKSGADSSARRVVIDRHIPEFSPTLKTRDGKPANLHKYLSRHERAEALGMRSGLSYADAHDKRAVPAERSAVRGDGVDWDAYNREMAGYLSHVEHEQVRKPPPGKLHVDPGKAIRTHQSGGGVLDWAYAPKLDLRTPEDPKKAYAAGYERDPPPLSKPPIAGSYEDGRAGLDLTMSGEGSSGAIGASVDPFNPRKWGVRGSYTKDITPPPLGRAAGGRVVAANINHRPTEAQAAAGTYAKDHVRVHGLDLTIENARGSTRRGVGADGKPWKSRLPAHYGYIKRTEGADGDHVDVYLGPHTASSRVWVIDQIDPDTGAFDEHKTFLGFASKAQVVRTYRGAFSDGRGLERLGSIKEMTVDAFKDWLKGDTSKPLNGKVPVAEPMIQRDAFQYHTKAGADRCEVCRYYSGPQGCGLYRMINQRMPDDFDLNPQVARDGWCSAYTDKRAKT